MSDDQPKNLLDVEGTRVQFGKLRDHGPIPNNIGELTEQSKTRLAYAHELSDEIETRDLNDVESVCPYLKMKSDIPEGAPEEDWEPDVDIAFFVFSGEWPSGGYDLSASALNYVYEKGGEVEFALVAQDKKLHESFPETDGPILKLRVKFPHLHE